KLLVGPGMGHEFHPESKKEFMAFHLDRQKAGLAVYPGNRTVKFTTFTLKYNNCAWVTVEEMFVPYRETVVEASADENARMLKATTKNVAVLQLGRDLAETVELDGDRLPLAGAAEGLLPGVYFENSGEHWRVLSYDSSLAFPKNVDQRK